MAALRFVTAYAVLALSSTLTFAQAPIAPHNGAERAYMDYVAAWKAEDLPALEAVIADDYMTLNGEKKVSHKADELQEAKSSPAYDSMHVDDIHSVVVNDTAVVSSLLTVAGTASGKAYHVQVRDLATFVRRNGHWQLLADQSAS